MRRVIRTNIKTFGIYQLDMVPLAHVVAMLSQILEQHPDANMDCNFSDSYSDTEFQIYEVRPETNKEEKERKATEAANEIARKRALLEQLKRELGES